jgi:hypothetical protein
MIFQNIHPFLMQFLQSIHPYELLMDHNKKLLFYFEKGFKFRIFERYIIFLNFSSNFNVVFVVECIVDGFPLYFTVSEINLTEEAE